VNRRNGGARLRALKATVVLSLSMCLGIDAEKNKARLLSEYQKQDALD